MKRGQWVSNLIEITESVKGLEGEGTTKTKSQST